MSHDDAGGWTPAGVHGARPRSSTEPPPLVFLRSPSLQDQVVGVLSHELRTPITVIEGFTSILQDELVGAVNAEQQACLGQIQGEAEHLLKLINDLLELGRIQGGLLRLDCRPMHLAEVGKDVIAQLAGVAQARQQRVVDELPSDLPLVRADDARVAQVLVHLLHNALKFAPERTTTVLRARVDGGFLRCEVADEGAPIPAAAATRLFQCFVQLDMSTTRQHGGMGLGLYLSKALVEAHQGAIGFTPGPGNVFWFSLPLAA